MLGRGYWAIILFLVLLVANVSIYRAIFAPRVLAVSVLDVGEAKTAGGGSPDPTNAGSRGDAILVHAPNSRTLLIDTGPDASILRALGTALPMWQRRIDAVILTSANTGATGGLPEVTSRYRIPTPVRFGTSAVPYGTRLALGDVSVTVFFSDMFTVSYGATSLAISSSTPKGVYLLDGEIITKTN